MLLGSSQHWSLAVYCLGQGDHYKALKSGHKFCLETELYIERDLIYKMKKKLFCCSTKEKSGLIPYFSSPSKWMDYFILYIWWLLTTGVAM